MKSDAITNMIILLCLLFCTAVITAYPPKAEDDATIYQALQQEQAKHALIAAKTTSGVRAVDVSDK